MDNITGTDGKTYQVDYFNLDLIISVGYRIKSTRGTQFRIWANKIVKDYLVKGYNINEKRPQEQPRQLDELKHIVKSIAIKSSPLELPSRGWGPKQATFINEKSGTNCSAIWAPM